MTIRGGALIELHSVTVDKKL